MLGQRTRELKKVTVRFTAGEYETISGEAESQGQGISDYIREWVLPR